MCYGEVNATKGYNVYRRNILFLGSPGLHLIREMKKAIKEAGFF